MEFEKKLFMKIEEEDWSQYRLLVIVIFLLRTKNFSFDLPPLRCMPLLPLFLLGDIVQCVFVVLLLFNKARSLLTAWGRVLCNSATDSASLMNCLAGLVNKWSRRSLVMEPQSTPKWVSYRELTMLRTRWSRRGDHKMNSWSGAEPRRQSPISDSQNRRNGAERSNIDANCDVTL